jgi:hypothetical protein
MSAANAMRAFRLPQHIRWLGGSIIDTQENGLTVAHGILTNDPRHYGEQRAYAPVACTSEAEVDSAVMFAIAQLEEESRV